MKSFFLEGPDNAGKSTLAHELSKRLGMLVYHQDKPRSLAEYNDAILFERNTNNLIFDRSMAISQVLYDRALHRKHIDGLSGDKAKANLTSILVHQIVIVCLPPDKHLYNIDPAKAEMPGVRENHAAICEQYKRLAENYAGFSNVVVYDYTVHTVDNVIDWLINDQGISNA